MKEVLKRSKTYPVVNLTREDPTSQHIKHWNINDIWVNIEDCKVFILTRSKTWKLIGNTSLRPLYYKPPKWLKKIQNRQN